MKQKLVNINDESYMILGRVSVETQYTSDELKSQYRLADTILRNGNELYICMKLIEADFEEKSA